MKNLTTLDFLTPIKFSTPISSYEDLYVIALNTVFDDSPNFFANRLVEIYYTHITESSKKNILLVFNYEVQEESLIEDSLIKDNFTQLTYDFTEYLDYMLLGKNINEGNLYPKLLVKVAEQFILNYKDPEQSVLDYCEKILEILRASYPHKEVQYILLPRRHYISWEQLHYIMNIGGTGYTPIYCNIREIGYYHWRGWGLNAKNEYKECLDKFLLGTNFTKLGKKIFILFTIDSYNKIIKVPIDVNWDEDNNELYFEENFRIQLSEYINNILFDIPLRFSRNKFEEMSKAFYTPILPRTEQETAEVLDDLSGGYSEERLAEILCALDIMYEAEHYIRPLIDEYVNILKCRYPEIEFRYIVLPTTEFRRTNIILNLPKVTINREINLFKPGVNLDDSEVESHQELNMMPMNKPKLPNSVPAVQGQGQGQGMEGVTPKRTLFFSVSTNVEEKNLEAGKPYDSSTKKHPYGILGHCPRCLDNPYLCNCFYTKAARERKDFNLTLVGNFTSTNNPSRVKTKVFDEKHLLNGKKGTQYFAIYDDSRRFLNPEYFHPHKIYSNKIQEEKSQKVLLDMLKKENKFEKIAAKDRITSKYINENIIMIGEEKIQIQGSLYSASKLETLKIEGDKEIGKGSSEIVD